MNCKETNIDSSFWNFVKKFPALRYMKAPVFEVSQLYERYKDGLESGAYAFVIKKFCFYGWDFKNKEWKKIGLTSEDLTWDNISDKPTIPDAQKQSDWKQEDEQAVDYIKNKPVIPEAPEIPTVTVSVINGQSDLTIWRGYETDFNSIDPKDDDTLYLIKEDPA